MDKRFDVIIIGAGPGGTSCAYNLKRINADLQILLLDKAEFPRYKTCGGGISPEVMNYLDFNLDEAIDYRCTSAVMVAQGQQTHSPINEMFMVRREVFDDFLLNQARLQGVEILTNCEALDIDTSTQYPLVTTSKGQFSTRFVVIAEGSRGKLARKLGIAPKNTVAAAMEYEHYTSKQEGSLYVDLDYNKGYAWNFPKTDGLSLGVGCFMKGKVKERIKLPEQLKLYIRQYDVHPVKQEHVHGHPVQLYSGRQQLVHGPILLVGEIAGCVDPLTAEGIRPAIKSGYWAASVLAETIESKQLKRLKRYNTRFHREIGKDFQYARLMSYFFYNYRHLILPLMNPSRMMEQFMRVFSGESTYRDQISKRRIFKMIRKIALNFFQKHFK